MKNENKKGMRVRSKLLLLSVFQIAALVAISITGLVAMSVVDKERTDRYNEFGMGQYELSEVFTQVNSMKVHLRNAACLYTAPSEDATQKSEITDIKTAEDNAKKAMEVFEVYLDDYNEDVIKKYNESKEKLDQYFETIDTIIEKLKADDTDGAVEELKGDNVKVANEAEDLQSELISMMSEDADIQGVQVTTLVRTMTIAIMVVCILVVIFALGLCVKIINGIVQPIHSLSAASRQLAEGDVNIKLKKISNDDLGELMDDFEMMASTIRDQAEVADEVAKGNMTVQVSPKGEKDLLGKALYKLVQDTDQNLSNVKESSVQVTVGSDQVATASQALAQGATEQASALQQVTASVNEIAEHTKDNATQANQADELMHEVRNMAVSGNEQMKGMIAAMEDINESSETISKIIKTIDDIAFQTNILALNAAVEAARAGVHGKGFAVVAEEVRNLAAKSASAASETAEMIEDSIQKVGHGTKLAESTAKALDEIAAAIERSAELIAAIATSSNDQATAVSQVDQAIGQVSQVVQTNSATSEECAAASEELSNQAANLRNLMSYYKLTGGKQHNGISGDDMDSDMSSGMDRLNDNEQIISLTGEFGKY